MGNLQTRETMERIYREVVAEDKKKRKKKAQKNLIQKPYPMTNLEQERW